MFTKLWNAVPAPVKTFLRALAAIAGAAALAAIVDGFKNGVPFNIRTIASAVIGAVLPVIIVALDKTDPRYGLGKTAG